MYFIIQNKPLKMFLCATYKLILLKKYKTFYKLQQIFNLGQPVSLIQWNLICLLMHSS